MKTVILVELCDDAEKLSFQFTDIMYIRFWRNYEREEFVAMCVCVCVER